MRVLHLYAGNLYGGIETLLATLARQRGLCPDLEPHFGLCFEGRLSEELRASGVPVYNLGPVRVSRPWTVWLARRRLNALLSRERFDRVLCHACWPHAVFASVVRRRQLPLVFWAHDVPTGRHWLERWARWTPPDLVLANSRFTQAALGTLFPRVGSEVLYPPVQPPQLPDRAQLRRQTRAALLTPEDAVVVIQASRLERLKGQDILLQALSRLADLPGWLCWMAGGIQRPREQAYFDQLHRTAREQGIGDRVRFLGQRDDVPRLLAAADIHCQPNTGPETFGLAFVEALYAGLPVVTTSLGGGMEIVDDRCGVLVPPGDVARLAQALRELMADAQNRTRLGGAGPAQAALLCDPKQTLHRLRDLLTR